MTSLATALVAAAAARAAWTALLGRAPGGGAAWRRTNHRGETVTLLEGPAWTAGALTGVLLAPLPSRVRAGTALAVGVSGLLGAVDDLAGTSSDKGLRGHLGALAQGRVTTGAVKVLGIGAAGVAAAGVLLRGRPRGGRLAALADTVVAGGVVAGTANLLNLLDLRPGRALKVALLPAPAALAGGNAAPLLAAAAGASAAVLGDDLGERAMLGDSGANAAGALLGCAVVTATARAGRPGPALRAAALAGLVALTLASERVSFTRVIETTPVLRELDGLGRRR